MNQPILTIEVLAEIRQLKTNNAFRIDEIINEYLKYSPNEVIYVMVKMFNIILNTGIVPAQWCIGIIQPIFKNKSAVNGNNNYIVVSAFIL